MILAQLSTAVHGTDATEFTAEERQEFAEAMARNIERTSTDDELVDAFLDYWQDRKPTRRCTVCGRLMRTGYCEAGGHAYYCSDECLHTRFTPEAWEQECEEDEQSYYTEWY